MVLLASTHKPENLDKFCMPVREYSSISDNRGKENGMACPVPIRLQLHGWYYGPSVTNTSEQGLHILQFIKILV